MNKKLSIALILFLFLIVPISNASAFQVLNLWQFDLSAVNANLGSYTGVNNMNFDSPGDSTTTIVQSTGGDGSVDVGDTFTETGYMQDLTLSSSSGTKVLDLTDEGTSTTYNLFASFQDITGKVTAINSSTSWDYAFDSGQTVRYFLDDNSDPFDASSGEITLATGKLVPVSGGTADGFIGGTSPQSNFSATLQFDFLYAGVFKDVNGVDLNSFPSAFASVTGVTSLDGTNSYNQNTAEYTFIGHTGDVMEIGAVPEPSTMILLGLGLLGLAGISRKKISTN
jgi:hypothetical protein